MDSQSLLSRQHPKALELSQRIHVIPKGQRQETTFISLKDAHFGYLSRCCAIVIYHWDDFQQFLDSHDYVTNRLACLMRDAMNLEYVKIVIAVVASIGINLVSPYHAKTIASETCHSSLKEFLTELNTSLSYGVVDADFFNFEYPAFNCVSTNLF